MGLQIDVGDGSSAAADFVLVAVTPGVDTVTIANSANSPGNLNYFTNGIDGAATAIAPGANASVTSQTWLQSAGGVCTVKLTGGQYGS